MPESKHPLKVFLCHASADKFAVRALSQRLALEDWIDVWIDENKLLPGQDWRINILDAVETSDIVIICLSNNSVNKEGYVQKELRYAQEIALEKPEDSIFLIPLKLEECNVPRGLRFYQWVDFFDDKKEYSYKNLLLSLGLKYKQIESKREVAEKARLKVEEQERQRIAKKKAKRESTEETRLKAGEKGRQQIAKKKADRESAETFTREKAAQEEARHEEIKKNAREMPEFEVAEKVVREKLMRVISENAARAKAKQESDEKIAREKEDRETAEKARLEAEELTRQKEAKKKAARDKLERQIAKLKSMTRNEIPVSDFNQIRFEINILLSNEHAEAFKADLLDLQILVEVKQLELYIKELLQAEKDGDISLCKKQINKIMDWQRELPSIILRASEFEDAFMQILEVEKRINLYEDIRYYLDRKDFLGVIERLKKALTEFSKNNMLSGVEFQAILSYARVHIRQEIEHKKEEYDFESAVGFAEKFSVFSDDDIKYYKDLLLEQSNEIKEHLKRFDVSFKKDDLNDAEKSLVQAVKIAGKRQNLDLVNSQKILNARKFNLQLNRILKAFVYLVFSGIIFIALFILSSLFRLDPMIAPISTITSTHTFDFVTPTRTNTPSLTPTEKLPTATPLPIEKLPTATPLPTEINDTKGVSMMLVPAGTFKMGDSGNMGGEFDERPEHSVYLDSFYMDKYEVTNQDFVAFLNNNYDRITPTSTYYLIDGQEAFSLLCDVAYNPNSQNQCGFWRDKISDDITNKQFVALLTDKDDPVVLVTWYGALEYCKWRSNETLTVTLPTEAQWEKAARGTQEILYPWGNEKNCKFANYKGCVGNASPVGSYPSGISPYGIHDMAGNVWEWVSDWYDGNYYSSLSSIVSINPLGPLDGETKVFRGGSWYYDSASARTTQRGSSFDDLSTYSSLTIGFRCSGTP